MRLKARDSVGTTGPEVRRWLTDFLYPFEVVIVRPQISEVLSALIEPGRR